MGERSSERRRFPLARFRRYQYDTWGNCTEKRSGNREVQRYTWDGEHQLIQAQIENRHQRDGQSETWHYAYDPFGRRIAKWRSDLTDKPGQPAALTHYTWDGNRLLAESSQLPAHNPAEAQTRHTLYLYEPDSFVPLAQVDSTWEPDEHEALRAHLYTDPEQNQQLQAAQNDPFIWNWHVKPLHQRLREQMGLPALPPCKPPLTTRTLYYHTDHLGTPRELTDAYGQIVWAATYKAWGRVQNVEYPPILRTVQRGNTLAEEWVTPYPHERPVQNLRFQGQYCDEETGLHYNRFRYYDPECGRFVSQDPIGLFGGDNFYQYAPNPVEWIDPLGLTKKCCSALPKEQGAKKILGDPKDAQRLVRRGQAPKEISRIDKPEPTVPKSQWHAHATKKKGGGALNQDGTIHDRDPQFSKTTLEWLKSYGWEI